MTPQQIREFILAGNALFTIKSNRTGEHYTFKVRAAIPQADRPPTHWNVSVLSGRDNTRDYRRIGTIYHPRNLDFIRLGGIGSSVSLSTKGFDWFWTKLRLGDAEKLAQAQFSHAGRCGRCGRILTTPDSIAAGIGPECQDKMAFEAMGGVDGLLDSLFGTERNSL